MNPLHLRGAGAIAIGEPGIDDEDGGRLVGVQEAAERAGEDRAPEAAGLDLHRQDAVSPRDDEVHFRSRGAAPEVERRAFGEGLPELRRHPALEQRPGIGPFLQRAEIEDEPVAVRGGDRKLRVRAGYCAVPDFSAASVDAVELLLRATTALRDLRTAGDDDERVRAFDESGCAQP